MRRAPHILLVTSGLGYGHTQAASAVAGQLQRHSPAAVVRRFDFWSLMNPGVAESIQQIYLRLVQYHPDLYERIYHLPQHTWRRIIENAGEPPDEVFDLIEIILQNSTVRDWLESALRRYPSDLLLYPTACATLPAGSRSRNMGVARLALLRWIWLRLVRRMAQQILTFRPDVVISTQMVAAALVSAVKSQRGLAFPAVAVVTDFGVHDYWIQPRTDLYCVADESLIGRPFGTEQGSQVVATGVPLMPDYSSPPSAAESRAELGFDTSIPVVLILGGGLGLGVDTVARHLLTSRLPMHLIVMTGRNHRARAALESLHDARVLICDWTDQVATFFAAADIVVGKPGGLTVAEALACGRPLLATRSLRGQEGFNVEFIERHGVGKLVAEEHLAAQVETWLSDRQALASVKQRALALGRRDGALRVARYAIELAGSVRGEAALEARS